MNPQRKKDSPPPVSIKDADTPKAMERVAATPSLDGIPTELRDIIIEYLDIASCSRLSRVNRRLHEEIIPRIFKVVDLDLKLITVSEESAKAMKTRIHEHTEAMILYVPKEANVQPIVQVLIEGCNPDNLSRLVFRDQDIIGAKKRSDMWSYLDGGCHRVLADFLAKQSGLVQIDLPATMTSMTNNTSHTTKRKRAQRIAALPDGQKSSNLPFSTAMTLRTPSDTSSPLLRVIIKGGDCGTSSHTARQLLEKFRPTLPLESISFQNEYKNSKGRSYQHDKNFQQHLRRLDISGTDDIKTADLHFRFEDMSKVWREDLKAIHVQSLRRVELHDCARIGPFLDHLAARGVDLRLEEFEILEDVHQSFQTPGERDSLRHFLKFFRGLRLLSIQLIASLSPLVFVGLAAALAHHGTTLRVLKLLNTDESFKEEALANISDACPNIQELGIDLVSLTWMVSMPERTRTEFMEGVKGIAHFSQLDTLELYTESVFAPMPNEILKVLKDLRTIYDGKVKGGGVGKLETIIHVARAHRWPHSTIDASEPVTKWEYTWDGEGYVYDGEIMD